MDTTARGNERVIRRDAFARCPFSAAVERAQPILARARFSVLAIEDFTDTVRRHDALEFRWRPSIALLPAARALLTVRPHAPQGTELQLSLAYVPPLGVFGKAFDHVIGRHVAWLTAGVLLMELKYALGANNFLYSSRTR